MYGIGELLLKATPLMLCALGLAIGFRANVWNIGAEGQFLSAGKKLLDTSHPAFKAVTAVRTRVMDAWATCILQVVSGPTPSAITVRPV